MGFIFLVIFCSLSVHSILATENGGNHGVSHNDWRIALGRATWHLLHTTAAKYPEEPTQIHRDGILSLMGSLQVLFPCEACRLNLANNLKKLPSLELFTGILYYLAL